jgi:alginate O-acetyltransferase complex protein AlgI
MLFNSIEFLIFFPIVTVLYFLLPHKYRWAHLLLSSCIFYAAFVPKYLIILFLTIVVDYFAGILIESSHGKKRKWWLLASLVANIGVLVIFKYFNFIAGNINALLNISIPDSPNIPLLNFLLPIGLSFHTFQAMSYTIEVYRGNHKAEKHFGIYALYVMFYPQLVAGPIERPQQVLHQFHEKHKFSYYNLQEGLKLIGWGLIKKVIIADRFAQITDPVYNNPFNYPALTIFISMILFSYQIYCDFSGYSDIALGTARVMGFRLMKNFDNPYHSSSISEFWRRWHISLSFWFRDYLYIPLGGSRGSQFRKYLNLFIVFMVSGLWHGASWTFIVWGALHGVYQIAGSVLKPVRDRAASILGMRKESPVRKFIGIISTFTLVTCAWVFFRASNFTNAKHMLSQLVYLPNDIKLYLTTNTFSLGENMPSAKVLVLYLGLAALLELIVVLNKKTQVNALLKRQPTLVRWSVYYACIFAIIMLGVFEERQFIYFQF